jgi:pyruvate carboxylase subunit A
MFSRILIANRGEIAVRIMRACRELGIRSIAVYSEADKSALFTRYADEAHLIGSAPAPQSYLNVRKLIETAKAAGAEAIHPGYGFLAEDPRFAEACVQNGLKFIGPSSSVLAMLGDKVAARREMVKNGVPVVPGTNEAVAGVDAGASAAKAIGYPVIIKPSGGGGGIGMTVVKNEKDLPSALASAKAIASTTFGIGDLYIEKYLPNPRHIEFQILGDSLGNVIHLGERECSIQRRHQKLIEESPSPALSPELRAEMGDVAVRAAKSIGYEGAGTVEFLFFEGKFYFMEVNARVQVEHPVTEMVTGVDIVKEQIRIAAGIPLSVRQEEVTIKGSAIECRINAEDPLNDFVPTPGKINGYYPPGGPGIRVDSGIAGSDTISPYYDSLIAKLIVWGKDRSESIQRMQRALYEFTITGVTTNIPFHLAVMVNRRFIDGDLGTHFIDTEAALADDIKKIVEQATLLSDKMQDGSDKRRKIAAAVAAAMVMNRNR